MDSKMLHNRLSEAKWFAFDLDDTLHSFRSASTAAITSTLHLILTQHPSLNLQDLQNSYTQVLKANTKAAFTDGKTSHQYREARFRILLENSGVETTEHELKALLECYEDTFVAKLELKPYAMSLIHYLKAQNKKIAIITEGPQDAQERTLAALGLTPFVDYLATTNKLGVAKINGMFPHVVQTLGVRAEEVVMVGDSWERDMVPALDAKLVCVWFDEKGDGGAEVDGVARISTLRELQGLVEGV
jgi:putative hydrolase of the HAD superfamily